MKHYTVKATAEVYFEFEIEAESDEEAAGIAQEQLKFSGVGSGEIIDEVCYIEEITEMEV